jgi:hypothetical protein
MNEPAPESLGSAGASKWSAIVKDYDLRADELAILENACRAADMISGVEKVWSDEGRPMYTKGSMGQLVEHPAPKGIRAWQTTMDTALARLKLPDLDGGEDVNQNRDAANASWQPGVRGRGA